MTITESPPADVAVDEESAGERSSRGLQTLLTTSDHKTVGRMFVAWSLVFALATTVLGVLVGLERVDPVQSDDLFGGLNAYFQMWSLYRFAFLLLVVMPLILGVALVVVPMQVGATNIAFPRAALASVWAWLLGSGITVVAVGAGGGWSALDGVTANERDAIALTLAGTVFTIVALLTAALCVATTVISSRTPGMNLLRVPLFAWSMLVACVTWLFTLPILVSNMALIYVDLRGRDPIAFGTTDAGMWAQLDWVFAQPAIYAAAIPVLGIAGDIVPVAAKVRAAQHAILVSAIGLMGLLSIGGWIQPFMTAPADHRDEFVYVAFGIAAVLPVLLVLGGLGATLGRGSSGLVGVPSTMLIGALGAVLLFEAAVIAGALRVIEPFELLDRSTTTAVFNATVVAALLAAVAAIWYWAPKVLGTTLPEGVGRLATLTILVGGLVLVIPDVVAGFFLAPDVLVSEPAESLVDVLVYVSMVGGALVALGALLAVVAVARTLRRGQPAAGDDPWDGHTLEWATASPPPADNFTEPFERVVSERPLLDRLEAETEGT